MSDLGSDGADLGSGLSIPSLPSVSTPSGRSGHGVFGGGGAKGADAPPLTGKRTMAGWLHKEGKRLRGRTRRYLIATDEVLAQAPKEGASPSWTVARDDAHVYPGERPLELVVATPRRTVSYFAEDTAELVRWLRALRNSQSVRFGWAGVGSGSEVGVEEGGGSDAQRGERVCCGCGRHVVSSRDWGLRLLVELLVYRLVTAGGEGECGGVPLRWGRSPAMHAARLRGLLDLAPCR